MAQRGYRTGILDLTRGEMGTRGSADDREREAAEAARILQASWRGALDIPDGRVENTWENKLKVARVLREQRPRVVILPYWKGRHPDHYTASTLGYEACFLAGLSKLDCSAAVSAAVVVGVSPTTSRAGRPAGCRRHSTGTAPALQDHLRNVVLRRTPHLRGRHHRAVRGTLPIADGVQDTILRPGSRQRPFPCPKRNSCSHRCHGTLLRNAGWRRVTPSPSCRKKSGWWMIC